MRKLAWQVSHSRLGWPGVAAGLLLASAVAAQFFFVQPLEARIDTMTTPSGHMQVRRAAADDPAQRLERFHRHFRQSGPVADQLARIYRIAAAHGVTLAKGEYRLVGDADSPLRRYEVTFPVTAPYPSIRAFLGEALEELPTAALEQVTFERKRIGESGVEAQVRLTLYVEQ